MFILLLSSLVSSAPAIKSVVTGGELTVSSNLPEAIRLNSTREWEIHLLNSTTNIIRGASCVLHIYDEMGDGGHNYKNTSSVVVDGDIEMISVGNVFPEKGVYSYKAICNTTTQAGLYEQSFYVTKEGQPPADDIFTMFIYILFILSIIGLFYTFLLTIANIATTSETVYDVLLSWGFIILTMVTNYLAGEYLLRTFVENLTAQLLTYLAWTNGVLPMIALIITFFVKGTQKKNVLSVQEVSGRYVHG
jgi:hypothetical protein